MGPFETATGSTIGRRINNIDLSEISIKAKFLSFKTLISFVLGFLMLYFLYRQVDLGKTINVAKQCRLSLFLLAFIVFYLSILLRGLRWNVLLKNIGFRGTNTAAVEILFLSWFANVLVPAKLGDIYRAYLIRKNYDFSMLKTFGSIYSERVFDMIFLFLLFGLSGLISFKAKLPPNVVNMLIISFSMATLLILLLLIMKHSRRLIKKVVPKRFSRFYDLFEEGALLSLKQIPLVSSCTIGIWVLECGSLFLVVHAINIHIGVPIIVFVALAASLLTTLPITPAGLGAVEGAMVIILSLFGIGTDVGVSIAILGRLISYWSILPLGFVTYLFSQRK